MNHSPLLLVLLVVLEFVASPLQGLGQQRRRVEIQQAQSMRNLIRDGVQIRRLLGNVVIAHEGVIMACDSAYEHAGANIFEAFGNVVVTHGESRLYGDSMRYDGNTGMARVRGQEVRLVDGDATLITQHLDYCTTTRTAHFFHGGILFNPDSRLSSRQGVYHIPERRVLFIGDVALENPDGLLNTDTLEYFTETEMARFYGPTRILHGADYLYAEQGWYSQPDQQAGLSRNAFVEREHYWIAAHTIAYDDRMGFVRATGSVAIIDTVNRVTLFGQTATFHRPSERAELMDRPLALMVSEEGDSLFLRADTLRSQAYPLPNPPPDAASPPDTTFRMVRAIGAVRFYRHDFQGVADSMVFSSLDSTLTLFVDPVLWNEHHQISARRMKAFFRDETIRRVELRETGFLGSQDDSIRFNQITGRDMDILFTDGELHRLEVTNSAQMVYFIRDQGQLTAVNRAEGSGIRIKVRENQVTTVSFTGQPISNILPIHQAQHEDITLPGFKWEQQRRPGSEWDVIPPGLEIDAHKVQVGRARAYRNTLVRPKESLQP